jgi:hypothetical protein
MKARLVAFRSIYFNPATAWVMATDFPCAPMLGDHTRGLQV